VNAYGNAKGRTTLAVRQGSHVIEVRYGDRPAQAWRFDAMPGAQLEHTFTPPPEEVGAPPPAPSKTMPILLTSLGGAMLAGGAVTGILALDQSKRIERACPEGTCPNGYGLDDKRAAAQAFGRATDVLLIGGGVVAAAGVTWLFWPRKSAQTPAPSVACTGTGCGAFVNGQF
jgi:hypothetical protein